MSILLPYKTLLPVFAAGILAASPASAATIKTLHVFTGPGGDGTPAGGLATDRTGMLYGVTSEGGKPDPVYCPDGCGTIFSIDPSTGKFAIAHKFTAAEGVGPVGPLVSDGAGGFYGTTSVGTGIAGVSGTIFRYDIAKRKVTVLYSIPSPGDSILGFVPDCSVTAPALGKGGLYLKYSCDGPATFNDIYKFDFATKTLKTIDTPNKQKNSTGVIVIGGGNGDSALDSHMVVDKDGGIYGTVGPASAKATGKLFRINPTTDRIVGVHALTAKDGGGVSGPLTAAADGSLYGTTVRGNISTLSDYPEIFKFDPAKAMFTVLHRFSAKDDIPSPEGTTALSPNGKFLYGFTVSDELGRHSALYRLDVETRAFKLLHVFTGDEGSVDDIREGNPPAGLKFARGRLFGTTVSGGNPKRCGLDGCGTVFEVVP